MFDNKLNNSKKCSRNSNNIDTQCLKKCIKWNLNVKSEDILSIFYESYKVSCENGNNMCNNISKCFPIDTTKINCRNSAKYKFIIEFFLPSNNNLLNFQIIDLTLNVNNSKYRQLFTKKIS